MEQRDEENPELVLRYDSEAVPEGAVFSATRYDGNSDALPETNSVSVPHMSRSMLEAAAAMSVGGTEYRYYHFSLKGGSGEVSLTGNAVIQFHIPEDWDIDSVLVTRMFLIEDIPTQQVHSALLADRKISVDSDNNVITINVQNGKNLPSLGGFLFVQQAVNRDVVAETADPGIYRASMVLMHQTLNQRSMADAAFYGHQGYIEVDSSGQRTLFLRFQPILLGANNYLAKTNLPGEIIDYFTTEEIGTMVGNDGKTYPGDGGTAEAYGLHYPEILSVPINKGLRGFSIVIPAMNMMAGMHPTSELGAKSVRVFFTKIEKLNEGDAAVNPYAGYDYSVLDVRIEETEKLAAALVDGEIKTALLKEIDTAKTVSTAQAVVKASSGKCDSDVVKGAIDALAAAVERAKSGVVIEKTGREKLEEVVLRVEALVAGVKDGEYEESSLAALNGALAAARAALADESAPDARLETSRTALELAEAALVRNADITKKTLVTGVNDIDVTLRASDGAGLSIGGNGAIKGATYTVSDEANWLTITLGEYAPIPSMPDTKGYLLEFVPDAVSSATPSATTTGEQKATYTYYDGESDPIYDYGADGKPIYYPKTVAFDVKPGQTDIAVTFYAPFLSGTIVADEQTAVLSIDWSVFDLGNQTAVGKDNLQAALSAAKTEAAKTDEYTADSLALLNANIAAAEALLKQQYASQSMVDARVTAITAASAALVKAPVDKTALDSVIAEAGSLVKSPDYTETSIAALQTALTEAQKVAADENATAAEVAEALGALKSAISGLAAKAADKTELTAALGAAQALYKAGNDGGVYTADTWSAFASAYGAAQAVLEDTAATSSAVGAALANLNSAKAGLKVDIASLETAITEAAKYLEGGEYETASLAALASAKAAADSAVAAGELTAGQSEALTALVSKAIDALVETAALTGRAPETYSLAGKTHLWNHSQWTLNVRQDSMGNAAIDHAQSKLVVDKDGNARLHLFFGPLEEEVGDGIFKGYLQRLSLVTPVGTDNQGYTIYEKEAATVVTDWGTEKDDYWKEEYGAYPKELSIPVTIGATEVVLVEVFVPVMEAIRSGTGTQLAVVDIDWSEFEFDRADVAALQVVIDAVPETTEGKSADIRAALTASVAAGQYLIGSNETLTVTTEMADARADAITAAIAALTTVDEDEPAQPEQPTQPEQPVEPEEPEAPTQAAPVEVEVNPDDVSVDESGKASVTVDADAI
ncbi:MAG: FIVAR domain-containing protein, partial [Oscillospiraceae bacterium]|nr:FIVAR domain-containing protein [Oscillospiraceae bacterium]